MSDCCIDIRKYCQDADCTCEKTDNGIVIKLTGRTKEKTKELHQLVDKCDCSCC